MSYTCKLWWPASGTYAEASVKLTMKSFEHGNMKTDARNQSIVRTRAGRTLVYDRGINLNSALRMEFRQIPDEQRAQLLSFLSAVSWGASRIALEDYRKERYTVRISQTNLESTDTGLRIYRDETSILWDFNLEAVDLTNTSDAFGEEPLMPSPLAIHLTDYDHPHNPETSIEIDIADGVTTVESLLTRDWKAAIWLLVAEKDDQRYFCTLSGTHDGFSTTDATTVTTPTLTVLNDTGGVGAKITFTVDISGSGSTQSMRLRAETTEDGFTIRCRRFKL